MELKSFAVFKKCLESAQARRDEAVRLERDIGFNAR